MKQMLVIANVNDERHALSSLVSWKDFPLLAAPAKGQPIRLLDDYEGEVELVRGEPTDSINVVYVKVTPPAYRKMQEQGWRPA